jgi:hypothetical protein
MLKSGRATCYLLAAGLNGNLLVGTFKGPSERGTPLKVRFYVPVSP